jgi:hypothetical protein
MASDRSGPMPYTPAAPHGVTDFSRAVWDEFYRIAQGIFELDRPAAVAGASRENVTVSPAAAWDRLFDESDAIQYERPEGQLNKLTGIWTAPMEGLYLIEPVIEVPAFASPASKLYTASLRTTTTRQGSAPVQETSKVGGDDRVPLRIVAVFLWPLNRGDTIFWDLDLTHETKTGTVSVLSVINITRQSSIK